MIVVQWDNRPINGAGEEFYVRGVTVSTIRWGKITSATTYVFDHEALAPHWGEVPL